MKYILHTDGGSRQNPGPAAIGGIINDEKGNVIDTFSKYIGIKTNNFAEYSALIEGLDRAIKKDIKEIDCYLDSELVVKQIKGIYKVKDEILKGLHTKVKEKLSKFDQINFIHVKKHLNKEDDKLVNEALDREERK